MTQAVELLQPKVAISRYAKAMTDDSWCVDVSVHPSKALHTKSNRNATIDHFRYGFTSWASSKNIRVDTSNYAGFLNNLADRLISEMPRVHGSSFKPVADRFFSSNGAMFANTFAPFAPPVTERFEMPEILDDYLARIFMNDSDRKYVTQWLADIIQNPTRRPQWGVVLTGQQGTGKSSVSRLISAALGFRHTWESNRYAPAFEKFSEVFPDHLLVTFDDAPVAKDTYLRLKQAITRRAMQVELKGVQKKVGREVYARVLICSNFLLPIEQGDRRLYFAEPSEHKVSPAETASFFVRFNDWLEKPDTPSTLYHWLKSIDLADFVSGSTIQTDTHAKAVGLGASALETLLANFIAVDEGELSPIFHNNSLLAYLADHGCRNPNADSIRLKMHALGYEHSRRIVSGCNSDKQISVWQKQCKRSRALTEGEVSAIREAYNRIF